MRGGVGRRLSSADWLIFDNDNSKEAGSCDGIRDAT